ALDHPQRDADFLAHIVSSPCKRPGTRFPALYLRRRRRAQIDMGSCPAAFVARSSPVGAMPRDVRRRSRGLALLAFCIILLSARAGFSQYNTAEISGSVRDEQGGLLPGASVVVANGAVGARLER